MHLMTLKRTIRLKYYTSSCNTKTIKTEGILIASIIGVVMVEYTFPMMMKLISDLIMKQRLAEVMP